MTTEPKPGPKLPLPCIACGKKLVGAVPGKQTRNQPHAGTAFTSPGHYGSTVFDPLNATYLELNVCDGCLRKNSSRVAHVKPVPRERDPPPSIEVWTPPDD